MMLGIPARSSTRNDKGRSNHAGAISERNTATPMLRGSEMTSARKEETIVPNTKGSAPYSSRTGSQLLSAKNVHPNFSIATSAPRYISYPISTTRRRTPAAKRAVRYLKTRSARLEPSGFDPETERSFPAVAVPETTFIRYFPNEQLN